MHSNAFQRVVSRMCASAILVWGLGGGFSSSVTAAGVSVALLPETTVVQQGEIFELQITVPAPDDSFNAYETNIAYDPSVLTFIQLTPVSQQEGELMTSACSFRWHIFTPSSGSFNISHALLCAGIKVAGPGITYKLRFQANLVDEMTTVGFTSILFADAGVQVLPVTTADATITVGNATGVPGDDGQASRIAMPAPRPNPFRTTARVTFASDVGGNVRLEVFSVDGRRVRDLYQGYIAGGEERSVTWDGRDDSGADTPAGVYFLRLITPEGQGTSRISKLP